MPTNEIKATARILIHRPANEVFEAFADPEQMTSFWFPRSTGRLNAGSSVKWHVGTAENAPSIDVIVQDIQKGALILIQWGIGDRFTTVRWTFTPQSDDTTFVEIEESGFEGDEDEIVAKAIDSTGGFNQVIVAAKALLEHGVEINVVKDHAVNDR